MLIVQEDTRARQAIKNTKAQMEQQKQQMDAMALVAHETGCDLYTCPALTGKKSLCFKHEPDRIINGA